MKRALSVIVTAMFLVSIPGVTRSQAQLLYGKPSAGVPSIFNYGWRGLLLGALAGLSAGYIRYSDDTNNDNLLRSVGYGSLVGAGLGLAAGAVDVDQGRIWMGDVFIRDMFRASGFGVGVGSIWGGINAIINNSWKDLGRGAAWGYLGGLVLGAAVAVYEGPRVLGETTTASAGPAGRMTFIRDSRGEWCPAVETSWSF